MKFSYGLLVCSLIFIVPTGGDAAAQEQTESQISDFDSYRQEQDQAFEEYKKTLEAEWQAWVIADSLAFADFKRQVEGKWGSVTPTTKKDWVEYAEDKESLSAVDFEKGEAVVAILVEESAVVPEAANLARLEAAVLNLVGDQGKTMDYAVADQLPRPLGNRPVLEGQLTNDSGQAVTSANAQLFAEEVVKRAGVKRTKVASKDGILRIKLEVSIPLVPMHLRIRAQQFVDPVRYYADKYELDARVVMAIIHTESYFNPKAKSHIPAFGLMQLVPRYGAKDAYLFIYQKDQLLPPNYLYNPKQNVELGCAYLHIVMTKYLRKIEDPQSRLYCTIAAYNTGVGNVSKAFTGDRNINVAAREINAMTPDEVLVRLKSSLPYQETRDYITRILDRVRYYEEWRN